MGEVMVEWLSQEDHTPHPKLNHMKLSAKISLINSANALANHWIPLIRKACAEFKGKAYLATGGRSKKFQAAMEALQLPNNGNVRVRLSQSYSSLYAYINISQNVDDRYDSYETSFYIGKVVETPSANAETGHIVVSENEFTEQKTDYNLSSLIEAMDQVDALKKQIALIEQEKGLRYFSDCYRG